MNNGSYHIKAKMRDVGNIESFAKKFGIGMGRSFLLTITFKNNVTDKKEAGQYLNLMFTALRRVFTPIRYISVCERQRRGAWHFHVLCSCKTASLNNFKKYLTRFIADSGKPFGFFHAKWTTGENIRSVAKYLTKYLLKAEDREKGVRYVSYSNNWRRPWTAGFSFAYGKGRELWRIPCRELHKIYGRHFEEFYSKVPLDWIIDLVKSYLNTPKEIFLLENPLLLYYQKRNKETFEKLIARSYLAVAGLNQTLHDFLNYDPWQYVAPKTKTDLSMYLRGEWVI